MVIKNYDAYAVIKQTANDRKGKTFYTLCVDFEESNAKHRAMECNMWSKDFIREEPYRVVPCKVSIKVEE